MFSVQRLLRNFEGNTGARETNGAGSFYMIYLFRISESGGGNAHFVVLGDTVRRHLQQVHFLLRSIAVPQE